MQREEAGNVVGDGGPRLACGPADRGLRGSPPGATLRAALAELLEGGEVRTTRDLPETDPGDPVRYRRGLVFYELGPGA